MTMDLPAGGYSYLFGAHQINWEEGTVQALISGKRLGGGHSPAA
ncbi:hypothetical protein PO124_22100 [Bacillus licheniformis]|nr:hypothetical protein [Bacillus licheniformis]